MIRVAHRVSFARFVFMAAALSNASREGGAYMEWRKALDAIESDDVKHRLEHIHQRMMLILVRHMITGSVFLAVVLGVLGVLGVVVILRGAAARVIDGVAEILVNRLPALEVVEDEAVETQYPGVALA